MQQIQEFGLTELKSNTTHTALGLTHAFILLLRPIKGKAHYVHLNRSKRALWREGERKVRERATVHCCHIPGKSRPYIVYVG